MQCIECNGTSFEDWLVLSSVPDGDKQEFCSFTCLELFVQRII